MNSEPSSHDVNAENQEAQIQQTLSFAQIIDGITMKDPFEMSFKDIQFLQKATQGTPQECQYLLLKGGIDIFLKLLESRDTIIVDYAIYGLGNMAHQKGTHKEELVRKGGLQKLLMVTKRHQLNIEIFEHGLWAMRNITTKKTIRFEQQSQVIVYFSKLIARDMIRDQQLLKTCLNTIKGYGECSRSDYMNRLNIIMYTNLTSQLMKLLSHTMILGMFSSETTQETDYLLENDIIQHTHILLFSSYERVRILVCWIYSNIVGSTIQHDRILLNNVHLMEDLLVMLKNDTVKVGTQIAFIFCNLMIHADNMTALMILEKCKICWYFVELILRCQNQIQYPSLKTVIKCLADMLGHSQRFHKQSKQKLFLKLCNFDLKTLLQSYMIFPDQQVRSQAESFLNKYFRQNNFELQQVVQLNGSFQNVVTRWQTMINRQRNN